MPASAGEGSPLRPAAVPAAASATMEELEELGRVRLSTHFYMREMLYSELANFHGMKNIPDDPPLAVREPQERTHFLPGLIYAANVQQAPLLHPTQACFLTRLGVWIRLRRGGSSARRSWSRCTPRSGEW